MQNHCSPKNGVRCIHLQDFCSPTKCIIPRNDKFDCKTFVFVHKRNSTYFAFTFKVLCSSKKCVAVF